MPTAAEKVEAVGAKTLCIQLLLKKRRDGDWRQPRGKIAQRATRVPQKVREKGAALLQQAS